MRIRKNVWFILIALIMLSFAACTSGNKEAGKSPYRITLTMVGE